MFSLVEAKNMMKGWQYTLSNNNVLGLLILVIFYFDKGIVKRKRNYGFEEKVKLLSIIVIFFVITGVTFWKQQVVNLIYHTIALFAEPDFSKKKNRQT